MSDLIPDFIDKSGEKVLGKVSETAGDLLDAGLTYVGNNIIKKYKYNKADDEFNLESYKQAHEHALKMQEIKNQKIQKYYGDYIEANIKAIANQTLDLAQHIPTERQSPPNIGLIGRVFEEGKYTVEEDLRNLYAHLLVGSIDKAKNNNIQHIFIDIIGQLTSDEVKLFNSLPNNKLLEPIVNVNYEKRNAPGVFLYYRNFSLLGYKSNCEFPQNAPIYISNLCRLGLVETLDIFLVEDFRYTEIEKSESLKNIYNEIYEDGNNMNISLTKRTLGLTDLGQAFRSICIL